MAETIRQVNTQDIASLAIEMLRGNEAAQTALALRETALALGHEEDVVDDFLREANPYRSLALMTISAPQPLQTRFDILQRTSQTIDQDITVRHTGRKLILRTIADEQKMVWRFDPAGVAGARYLDQLYELEVACRRYLQRPTDSMWIEKKAFVLRSFVGHDFIRNIYEIERAVGSEQHARNTLQTS